ncbi:ABC-type Na+ efflux pump, permease component [Longilinea arvoryzae]|uniref:ABC-type Na+ efflux pump, permease component n=1 Tax=Longilinea arvoryzae TaxID=360412 RepID=A0A0S7BJC5_9CHLR|nr:ABC transporter permease [Longilinea arvoryzae]GAP14027.1 ABC-type Na+ efflux pump, permease component [Longilinea arvoryzae]
MSKLWLVFKHEYGHHVLRKRFLVALLSLPLMVVVMIGATFLAVRLDYDSRPAGYVDQSGLFTNARQLEVKKSDFTPKIQFHLYSDEASAQADLNNKTIQALFIIAPDYMKTGNVKMVALDSPGDQVQSNFRQFLVMNLLASKPKDLAARITQGANLIIKSVEGSREMAENNFLAILIPLIAGILFMVSINTSGGYLLQAVVEEKENRTMEIMVTSLSPNQLMAGKILGNLSVGLTQVVVWALCGLVAINFLTSAMPEYSVGSLLNPSFFWLMLATFLPSFIMVAALMAAVGATVTETREAQQVAGLFTLPIFLPLWFISVIMMHPNGGLAVAFSLFPLTAPLTLPMRAVLTDIPVWEIVLTIGLLILTAVGAIWVASRAFRLGMLRYGKRLAWKEIFGRAA